MDISTSSVRYGFILAAFSILLSLVTYLLDISSTGYLIGILSLVGSIFIMYFAGHTEKTNLVDLSVGSKLSKLYGFVE